jgi:hypothetical protein
MSTALRALPLLMLAACATSSPGDGDPLPSWNDGPHKQAILAFGKEAIAKYSPEERIAVFDNDGTLWCELPYPVQAAFLVDRVKALAPEHPEWKEKEPFKSILEGDVLKAQAQDEKALMELAVATHGGMNTEEFDRIVQDWISRARHPKTNRLYTEMVYQPMLEVLSYLRSCGFKTYIVSGGGADFMRPWTQRVYGIPPEQVVGSTSKVKYELVDGVPTLSRTGEPDFIDKGPGKPVGIYRALGRRPIAAFGNSDGDLQMLQWTAAGAGKRLALIVHHTDAPREGAYDRQSPVGKLDKALDEAAKKGWVVVDIKRDWRILYPFQK